MEKVQRVICVPDIIMISFIILLLLESIATGQNPAQEEKLNYEYRDNQYYEDTVKSKGKLKLVIIACSQQLFQPWFVGNTNMCRKCSVNYSYEEPLLTLSTGLVWTFI